MEIAHAQSDLRHSYFCGAPGLAVSATVWLLAGVTALVKNPQAATLVLFFGGMAIFPLSVGLTKLLGRPGTHAHGNPLGVLALEGTGILLLGTLTALTLAQWRVGLFFPAMLLVIGGRYLTFQTLYGLRLYWICGGALTALGFTSALLKFPITLIALTGGATEALFATVLFVQHRRPTKSS